MAGHVSILISIKVEARLLALNQAFQGGKNPEHYPCYW